MKVESFYPVLMSANVAELSAFYQERLGFACTFETSWYVSLRNESGFELAVLNPEHETVPHGFGAPAAGIILNVEVADAAAEYERLVRDGGLPEVLALRDEEFGQRHFITHDPAGNLIDVIENIEPSEAFAASFASGAE
jgi:uncharacterized glyoxalase superfamily protein PhnB